MSLTDEDKQWILNTLEERLSPLEVNFAEKLEGMETRLLTAFHGWASPVVTRQQSHSAALRVIDMEIEDLKKRVEKLENPAA